MARDELAARRTAKKARADAARALREALESGYGHKSKSVQAIPLAQKTATEYHEATGSWMHPFSDVRKDEAGFYILREDNPDGWRMKQNDLIQDVALNTTPYWRVVANDQERIDLEPIGPNPLLTGVGAGGYVFQAADFKVLTGEYELERVNKIVQRLESGEPLQIYDVKYLLMGTVPLNFGPNGPQGGWYNPNDTYSNRGRGKKPQEIVIADAEMLAHMGFDIPDAAIDGTIKPNEWGQFIESPAQMFSDWMEVRPVVDIDAFIANYLKAPWITESSRDPSEIEEGMRSYLKRPPRDSERWEIFQVPGESEWSLAEALAHPQEEVQMRAVSRALMMDFSSPPSWQLDSVVRDLYNFVVEARGSLSVYDRLLETVGNYFPYETAKPLLVAGTDLDNGYVRSRAYSGLARQRYKKLPNFVFKEKDGEALKAIASGLLDHGYMPGREVVQHLLVEFTSILKDGSVYTRYYASDGIKNLLRLANKQGVDTRDALDALEVYEESVRHNPYGNEATLDDDMAWLAMVNEVMTSTARSS